MGDKSKTTSWKTWSVTFRSGQVRSIHHQYRGDLGGSVGGRFSPPTGVDFFEYILTTGANWKGPISDFRLTLSTTGGVHPSDVYGTNLAGFYRRGDSYHLDLHDYTPREELFITLYNDFQGRPLRAPLQAPENWLNPEFRFRPVAGELCADSRNRHLGTTDLCGRSPRELTLMRNEIFARHGRPFVDPELRAYYSKQSWYHADVGYTDRVLSPVERRNAQFIYDYQTRHGITRSPQL
jgi:hypothetical protein